MYFFPLDLPLDLWIVLPTKDLRGGELYSVQESRVLWISQSLFDPLFVRAQYPIS